MGVGRSGLRGDRYNLVGHHCSELTQNTNHLFPPVLNTSTHAKGGRARSRNTQTTGSIYKFLISCFLHRGAHK